MQLDRESLTTAVLTGRASRDIAREFGTSSSTVLRAIRKLQISVPDRYPLLRDKRWLQSRLDKGESFTVIARAVGCRPQAVAIAARGLRRRDTRFPQLHDAQWLSAELSKGNSQEQIALYLGAAPKTVSDAIRKTLGIRRRNRYPELVDVAYLTARIANGSTLAEIARAVGCTASAVSKAMKRKEIGGRGMDNTVRTIRGELGRVGIHDDRTCHSRRELADLTGPPN